MDANPSKFQAIMLNAKMETRFNVGGDIITSEDTVILLGVALDKQLNFTQQTNKGALLQGCNPFERTPKNGKSARPGLPCLF